MEATSPLKAIRLKCLDCSGNNPYEVTECPIDTCPLFEYRSGHNPKRKGVGGKGNIEYINSALKSRAELGRES